MKKWQAIIIFLLLGVMFLTGCTSNSSNINVNEVIEDVLKLQFLADAGISPAVEPIEGFTRFLLLLLLFTLLFYGAEFVIRNRGVAIVLALTLSLITVIFIPSAILVAIGASYSTMFSMILLSVPVLFGIGLFWILRRHHWLRVILMSLLALLCYAMREYLWDNSKVWLVSESQYFSVLENVSGGFNVLFWIIIVMTILSLVWALFTFFTKRVVDATSWDDVKRHGKSFWKLMGNTGRFETAEINAGITDANERKLLNNADEARRVLETQLTIVKNKDAMLEQKDKEIIESTANILKMSLEEAKKQFVRVKRSGLKQKRQTDRILEQIKTYSTQHDSIKKREEEILGLHRTVETKINEALNILNPVFTFARHVSEQKTLPVKLPSKLLIQAISVLSNKYGGKYIAEAIEAENAVSSEYMKVGREIQEIVQSGPGGVFN